MFYNKQQKKNHHRNCIITQAYDDVFKKRTKCLSFNGLYYSLEDSLDIKVNEPNKHMKQNC